MKVFTIATLCFVFGSINAQTQPTENAQNQKESSLIITAAFAANKTTVCAGETVQFTDNSTGSPTTWSWQFAGGSPATSSVQNPLVQYNTPGSYNVVLTASNGTDQNTLGKLSIIRVEACTGINSTSADIGLRIFPVPANDVVYLQSYNDAKFTLLNLNGQVLQTGSLVANQTLALNTDFLSPGIYFLRAVENGISSTSKLIIE